MSKGSKTTSRKAKSVSPPYDFSKGQVGRYARRRHAGNSVRVTVVTLDDDVRAAFPDSKAVNRALRGLMQIMKEAPRRKAG